MTPNDLASYERRARKHELEIGHTMTDETLWKLMHFGGVLICIGFLTVLGPLLWALYRDLWK